MSRLKKDGHDESAALRRAHVEIAGLHELTVGALQARWRQVFGEPARSRNKAYLIKRLAYRLQEKATHGLTERAKQRIEELAKDAPIRRRQSRAQAAKERAASVAGARAVEAGPRDARLPAVGELIRKTHGGKEHLVRVRDDGFEYRGRVYRSLSAVAKQITGTVWNGWTFFGLKARAA